MRISLTDCEVSAISSKMLLDAGWGGTYPLAPFLRGRGNEGSPPRVGEEFKTQHEVLHYAVGREQHLLGKPHLAKNKSAISG